MLLTGYISEFYVHTGKEGGITEVHLGAKVDASLTKQLTGLYHHVYFDNYYTDEPFRLLNNEN